MSAKLQEKKIKAILIDYLISQKSASSIICSEVPFLGGKRWADILEIKENSLVAYEIKSDSDSLARLCGQIKDYRSTFNEVYVVLSKKFEGKQSEIPKDVGYFLVDSDIKEISLKRKSRTKKFGSKKSLSYFLWMRDIPYKIRNSKSTSCLVREELVARKKTKTLQDFAISALKKRYSDRFNLFREERGKKNTDFLSLEILTRKETRLD